MVFSATFNNISVLKNRWIYKIYSEYRNGRWYSYLTPCI
jgi:hypothetical protein